MKVRRGFVSNSSSSSFILDKRKLTPMQIYAIKNHMEYAHNHFPGCGFPYDPESDYWFSDEWYVQYADDPESSVIKMQTSMDNFSMRDFLELIGVDMDKAVIDRGY